MGFYDIPQVDNVSFCQSSNRSLCHLNCILKFVLGQLYLELVFLSV